MHASVMLEHFREYWLFGLFFAIVTPLQVALAVLVAGGRGDRRLLIAGIAGNLAIAATWTVSRVTGLPFGPEPFEPEAVGAKDVLATLDELTLAALGLALLAGRGVPRRVVTAAWALVALSVLASFLAGH